MTDRPPFTPDQAARAEALDQARHVLRSSAPLAVGGGTAPDAASLIQVARWIVQGDHPVPQRDLLDGYTGQDRDELAAEFIRDTEPSEKLADFSPHIRVHPHDRDDDPNARRMIWHRGTEAWVPLTGPAEFLRNDQIYMGHLLNYREQDLIELAAEMEEANSLCEHLGPRIGAELACCVLPEGHNPSIQHRAHPSLGDHIWV